MWDYRCRCSLTYFGCCGPFLLDWTGSKILLYVAYFVLFPSQFQRVWLSAQLPSTIVIGSSRWCPFDWSLAVLREGYPAARLPHAVLLRWINLVRVLHMVLFGADKNTLSRNWPPLKANYISLAGRLARRLFASQAPFLHRQAVVDRPRNGFTPHEDAYRNIPASEKSFETSDANLVRLSSI
jgi:hypothetical protein